MAGGAFARSHVHEGRTVNDHGQAQQATKNDITIGSDSSLLVATITIGTIGSDSGSTVCQPWMINGCNNWVLFSLHCWPSASHQCRGIVPRSTRPSASLTCLLSQIYLRQVMSVEELGFFFPHTWPSASHQCGFFPQEAGDLRQVSRVSFRRFTFGK